MLGTRPRREPAPAFCVFIEAVGAARLGQALSVTDLLYSPSPYPGLGDAWGQPSRAGPLDSVAKELGSHLLQVGGCLGEGVMAANSTGRAWVVLPCFSPPLRAGVDPQAATSFRGRGSPRWCQDLGASGSSPASARTPHPGWPGPCELSSTRATPAQSHTVHQPRGRYLGLRAPLGVIKSFPTLTLPPPNIVREPCSVPEAVPGAGASGAGQGALNQSCVCLEGLRKGATHH